jgi:hypothetical protein
MAGAVLVVSEPELRPPATPDMLAELNLTRRLPATYTSACRELAASVPPGIAACPPVIPAGALKVEVAAPFSRARRYRGGYSMSFASCSLDRYRGRSIETNGCHWAYELGWSHLTGRIVVERVTAAPGTVCRWRSLAGQRVRACRVPPFEQGGGFHGGHIAYLWERPAASVVLSVHGYRNEARVRAMMTALIATTGKP